MYQLREKKCAIIAIIYYAVMIMGYFLMGIMYKKGIEYYSVIQWALFGAAVMIVGLQDKSLGGLGFSRDRVKPNMLISGAIVIVSIVVALLCSDKQVVRILKGAVYYLFYIALMEEMIFRGFIQNYLFGLHVNRKIIFVIGALFFAFMHLPFQMYVNDMVSFSYVIVAVPQLVFTFVFHLIMCFVTYKSKDILIPTALHFAIDFLQAAI